jgi:hypothetical protein
MGCENIGWENVDRKSAWSHGCDTVEQYRRPNKEITHQNNVEDCCCEGGTLKKKKIKIESYSQTRLSAVMRRAIKVNAGL